MDMSEWKISKTAKFLALLVCFLTGGYFTLHQNRLKHPVFNPSRLMENQPFFSETTSQLSNIIYNHSHVKKNQILHQKEADFVRTFWNLLNQELTEPENQWVRILIQNPRKILIISTWRSGSSFFGQLLNQFPGTYYFFEPIKTMRVADANIVGALKDMLSCNFKDLIYSRSDHWILSQNLRLMPICNTTTSMKVNRMCFDSDLLSEVCSLFPIRLIKTVRLGTRAVERLMELIPELTVISLIRDVRGIMDSRQKVPWCNFPTCADTKLVCERYNQDAEISIDLTSKYPERFKLVRYEDLSLNLNRTVQSVAEFLGFPLGRQVITFLVNHTQSDGVDGRNVSINPHSTFRKSRSHTFQWRYSIKPKLLNQTQNLCAKGLSLMGFKLVPNFEALLDPQVHLMDPFFQNQTANKVWKRYPRHVFFDVSTSLVVTSNIG